MPDPVNRIAEFRKARKLTQQQLADAVGAHWITISKLERGKIQLSPDWVKKLSIALSVGPFDLYAEKETIQTLFLEGYISETSEAVWYVNDEGFSRPKTISIELGGQERGRDLWFTIDSDAFYPMIHRGDLIRVTYIVDEMAADCLGRLVVGGPIDAPPSLGILSPGQLPGTHQVRSVQGAPRPDIILNDLALVTMIVPKPKISKPNS